MTPLAYRPKEAAAVLGISRTTIYELIASGKLPARKIGAATIIRHIDLARILDEAPLALPTLAAHQKEVSTS